MRPRPATTTAALAVGALALAASAACGAGRRRRDRERGHDDEHHDPDAHAGGTAHDGAGQGLRARQVHPTHHGRQHGTLVPGTHMVYRGETIEDGEKIPHRVEFTVTDLTKVVAGVESVVILGGTSPGTRWSRSWRCSRRRTTRPSGGPVPRGVRGRRDRRDARRVRGQGRAGRDHDPRGRRWATRATPGLGAGGRVVGPCPGHQGR